MDSGDTFGGAFDPQGRLVMSILPGMASNPSPAQLAVPYWRKFRAVFPQAPERIGWDYGWFGKEALPADKLVKLYEPGPDAIIVLGYAGNGITQSLYVGRQVALRLAGKDSLVSRLAAPRICAAPLAGPLSWMLNRLLLPLGRRIVYRP